MSRQDEGPAWYDEVRRCLDCEVLLEGWQLNYCFDCDPRPPYTVTDRMRWLRKSTGFSMLECLEILIASACESDHILCTSFGRPIPLSSYRPRRGAPSGTLS